MKTSLLTAQTPLIILPPSPSLDAISAAYALAHFFENRGAHPLIVCADTIAESAPFLTPPKNVRTKLSGLQDFIIQFNTHHNAIDDVRITRTEDTVAIAVTPEGDFIDPRDFSFAPSQPHYDALFIVGAETLVQTRLANDASEQILREIPSATLCAEDDNPIISMTLFHYLWRNCSDALRDESAHCLLAGIVAATEGLRSPAITADLFRAVSTLMHRGGDLQAIMFALYKTVSFDFLRLWGGVLDRLEVSPSKNVAIATVAPLYGDDHLLLSRILVRTAQFLPHTHIVGALWRDALTGGTHGIVLLLQKNLSKTIPSLFSTAEPAPYNCLLITSEASPHDIVTQLEETLKQKKE